MIYDIFSYLFDNIYYIYRYILGDQPSSSHLPRRGPDVHRRGVLLGQEHHLGRPVPARHDVLREHAAGLFGLLALQPQASPGQAEVADLPTWKRDRVYLYIK